VIEPFEPAFSQRLVLVKKRGRNLLIFVVAQRQIEARCTSEQAIRPASYGGAGATCIKEFCIKEFLTKATALLMILASGMGENWAWLSSEAMSRNVRKVHSGLHKYKVDIQKRSKP